MPVYLFSQINLFSSRQSTKCNSVNLHQSIDLVSKNYVPVMNYGDIVKQNDGYLVIQVKKPSLNLAIFGKLINVNLF